MLLRHGMPVSIEHEAPAALGMLLHLSDADGPAVACRTLNAVYETHGLDMFAWLYCLIRGIAHKDRFAEIERLIMFESYMPTPFIPQTDFEAEHFYKGVRKGKQEGKAEAILAILAARNLTVTEDQRRVLLACTDAAKLDRVIARVVAARSVAKLLAELNA